MSEDRKTVTYTLDSTEVKNAKLTVKALDTDKKAADNTVIKTAEYNAVFSFEDVVAPEVADKKFNYTSATSADMTLKFSEELSSGSRTSCLNRYLPRCKQVITSWSDNNIPLIRTNSNCVLSSC